MFGSKAYGIPQNAGYYFGIKLIREYLERNPLQDIKILLKTPIDEIYKNNQGISSIIKNYKI
ncbi:DUF2268 domain-containing putative Zn-dependent protease [Anaerocolumna sp. AGMB13020]|uniref:DUF2268 domain-containing putative Zn-dependent protease n=1 Tax=Anaerocolumna sp. AGMB13020 TaxID=3081750 RepID=UPI003FA42588